MTTKPRRRRKVATVENGANGRTARGTFATGNRAAAGRRGRHVELREALADALTAVDVQRIVAALVARAARGDVVAATTLLDRYFGRPTAQVDVRKLEPNYDPTLPDPIFL
jgi:hypothetical protein